MGRDRAKTIVWLSVLASSAVTAAAEAPPSPRQAFLPAFARSYFPGRSGQIMVVPREGHFVTGTDPFMHGSPWEYDTRVPLVLHAPRHVRAGSYAGPARHQDIAPTILAVLGADPPKTMTGRPLAEALVKSAPAPRAVLLVVIDSFRADFLGRFELPNLSRLAAEGASFNRARVDYLPTATGVAHATIATGADPGAHGIVVNNLFDRAAGKSVDAFADGTAANMMAPALADVWVDRTRGRAIVAAQGGYFYAAAALAGHGGCRANGRPVYAAAYDRASGRWTTGSSCYRLHPALAGRTSAPLWEAASGRWLGHDASGPDAIRKTSLFAAHEADALVAVVEAEPIGADAVADLLLVNFKTPDFVAHLYGPDSREMAETLAATDAAIGRMVAAVRARAADALVVITADHGMPGLAGAGHRHLASDVVATLNARFDPDAKRLVRNYEPSNAQLYLDTARLAELRLELADVAKHLESLPFVFAAYTEDEVRRAARR
jgi:predicted AlkP superfamily pyrophosphatase or phosphodiesterase